jgi:hypothetical protein
MIFRQSVMALRTRTAECDDKAHRTRPLLPASAIRSANPSTGGCGLPDEAAADKEEIIRGAYHNAILPPSAQSISMSKRLIHKPLDPMSRRRWPEYFSRRTATICDSSSCLGWACKWL